MPVRVRLWALIRRLLRWGGYVVGGLLLLWLILLIALQVTLSLPAGQRSLRHQVLLLLEAALETDVELQNLKLSGPAHLSIEGLTIYDKACQPFVRVQEAQLGWSISAFWRGFWKGHLRLPLSALTLYRPEVFIYVERQSGLTNVDRLFPPDTTDTSSSKWQVSLPFFRIQEGRFRWCDSTQADSLLRPKPPFLNYAHLAFDSLSLNAAIEWLGQGRLFAHIRHLSLKETHSLLRLPHLSLILQAYPDSTVIPALAVQLPTSHLHGHGKFHQEGLDELFSNTDTKTFNATLTGQLCWRELYAFIGDSVPVAGTWQVRLEVAGDLYHFQAQRFRIEVAPGRFLRGEGAIFRYAKPALMHWQARLEEASLSLADIQRNIPVVTFPEALDTQYVWHFQAVHRGSLRAYESTLETPSLAVQSILRQDTAWHYRGQFHCTNWDPRTLWPQSPLTTLSGKATIEGIHFTLPDLTAHLQVDLRGSSPAYGELHLRSQGEIAAEALQGEFLFSSPQGTMTYVGRLPLTEKGIYTGQGYFSHLQAQLWGSYGGLTSSFALHGKGLPWAEGTATLTLDSLLWTTEDTLYGLGPLQLSVEQGRTYSLRGRGLSLALTGDSLWIVGLSHLAYPWAHWLTEGTWNPDTFSSPWTIKAQGYIQNPVWWPLAGLHPFPMVYGTAFHAEVKQTPGQLSGRLQLSFDSLAFSAIHLKRADLTLHFVQDSLPHWEIEGTLGGGKVYLLYQDAELSIRGNLHAGEIHLHGHIGDRYDSLTIALAWQWARGNEPIRFLLQPEETYLTSYQRRWQLTAKPLLLSTSGAWRIQELSAHSARSRVIFAGDTSRLTLQVEALPLAEPLSLLGEALPVEGLLWLSWQQQGDFPTFSLRIDSLRYEGQSYPLLWADGKTIGDSLPFRLGIGQKPAQYLIGKGYYLLSDTLSPLFAEVSHLNLPAAWLAPFLGEYIQNPQGSLRSARLIVRGTWREPALFGEVFCDNVSFYVPFTRIRYTVEGITRLRGDTLIFPDVEVRELQGKRAFLTGSLTWKGGHTPYLDLRFRLQDRPFLLAATPSTADAYLYGRAELEEGNLTLTGPWNKPTLRGTLRFSETTDLTLPLQTYERTLSTPHVHFISAGTERDTLSPLPVPAGVDMRIALRSAPLTRFRLLFDERTGDEIVAQGSANLLLSIDPEGAVALSGSYEVQGGEYRINLQGIAAKKLALEAGGLITWDGDLYAGQMNLTATYRTFTSLRMIDTSFTYTVPVDVRVLLRGSLLSPQMSFQIDIPSVGGNTSPMVNLFLQRLSTDEQERNRQVFALMVLGTFVPMEQGLGTQQVSSGVSSTLAEFLSAQLAGWLGQSLGHQLGVAFTLGQWNELSAQLRLSLGQRFTLERDGVLVAPGQSTASLGNLSARYRLLPQRLTSPTQWQVEVEGFSRQTFQWGLAGASSQGAGLRLRKGFYLPERRKKLLPPSTP
ncbi:MAG: translocation/assembly module TamB [Bacteroidia bacterium]|nr:translocation/assembly module TamB [Bacteroidia bacterium]